MSKTPNNDDLNDADISELFAADKSLSPIGDQALDEHVLSKARAAQHETENHYTNESFLQKYAPVIGSAAVLLIAFGLTPLSKNAPPANDESLAGAASGDSQVGTAAIRAKPVVESITIDDLQLEKNRQPDTIADTTTAATDNRFDAASDSDAAGLPETDEQASTQIQAPAPETVSTPEPELAPNPAPQAAPAPPADDDQLTNQSTISSASLEQSENSEQATDTDALAEDIETADAPINAFQARSRSNSVQTPATSNTQSAQLSPESIVESSVPIQTDALQNSDEISTDDTAAQRVSPENFRSSALLWIIEIRHLHNEKKVELAQKELQAFREAYPDNPNERLLPEILQQLKTE